MLPGVAASQKSPDKALIDHVGYKLAGPSICAVTNRTREQAYKLSRKRRLEQQHFSKIRIWRHGFAKLLVHDQKNDFILLLHYGNPWSNHVTPTVSWRSLHLLGGQEVPFVQGTYRDITVRYISSMGSNLSQVNPVFHNLL
jgi:hypothetical protein